MSMSEVKVQEVFVRKVDKSKIPSCNILGVNIAAINMEWLLRYLKTNVKSESGNLLAGDYICVSNVHTTISSFEDAEYCNIQNGGLMAIPDGGPLSTVGKKRGYKDMSRTTGPNLMEELFERSEEAGFRHFFYGSTEETLKKVYTELLKKNHDIQIAGMYSPPFRPLTDDEDMLIIKQINETKPDFIWIGLGAPKQERWMADHLGKLDGLMIGVGAGFDYFAGNINRAPNWMQKNNLEWFYRLIQEPKRLLKRYMYTNTKFIWHVMVRGK
ncbi:WecB/TagA/CpsF family glycosyltransferase [Gottfriedia sp. NPDC056225]|uniref:WecB/TagA/CpsF family glycosyltransferase n=1 Tax=Gottfriedia sp. NPDC056225 TaxID=3345751 RepID=UPI0035DDBC40